MKQDQLHWLMHNDNDYYDLHFRVSFHCLLFGWDLLTDQRQLATERVHNCTPLIIQNDDARMDNFFAVHVCHMRNSIRLRSCAYDTVV